MLWDIPNTSSFLESHVCTVTYQAASICCKHPSTREVDEPRKLALFSFWTHSRNRADAVAE